MISLYPLLMVILMVKNEADTIVPTLQPLVDGGIRHYLIYDTGSTDATLIVARDFFVKNSMCESQIIQEDFVDFAQSRNRALDLAGQLFPEVAFIFFPDAEWYAQNVPELLAFCQEQRGLYTPAYLIRLQSAGNDFYVPRLLRAAKKCRFVGAVHEVINTASHEKVPESFFCAWQFTQESQEKSQARYQRDRQLLFYEYEKNPHNSRTVFYLAQACWGAGDLHAAYHWYHVRTGMQGWEEEDYLTWYRLALVTQELAKNDQQFTWHEAQQYYLHAYAMRPIRAEPLVRIAEYYYHAGMLPICRLFAEKACAIPMPHDIGFVEKYMYDTLRYTLLEARE